MRWAIWHVRWCLLITRRTTPSLPTIATFQQEMPKAEFSAAIRFAIEVKSTSFQRSNVGLKKGNLSFILSDTQEVLRSRADRAFEHLQRMIVADSDYKAKWQAAFDRGEEACEQLGAVHLLLHGIWAFKA